MSSGKSTKSAEIVRSRSRLIARDIGLILEAARLNSRAAVLGSAAVLAVAASPLPAHAEEPGAMEEITVTASRRVQTVEAVPYAISVVSGEQLARTGVTDLASLAHQVPGLSLADFGARFSAATVPIMRGINAGDIVTSPQNLGQPPVGTYVGNSPVTGYFQLDDIQRVEVLQGPQGTLYGAGALGGAVRIIPNAPELGGLSGKFAIGGGSTAHADKASYMASGMLNVPLTETLAFRVAAKYSYDPGFIDVFGILLRPGPSLTAIPVAADPADPINSSGIYTGKKGWNYQKTATGRASLLWKPNDVFSADLAFLYSNVNGVGGPLTNTDVKAGPYPIDPRISFPAGGPYQYFSGIDEPYSRNTALTSLDLTYDAGFATVSSTSSYYTNRGHAYQDYTYPVFSFEPFTAYYTGNPIFPRFVGVQDFIDSDKTFTQEVRLVSKAGPDHPIDYVVGAFYEKQNRISYWGLGEPGTQEWTLAKGCTAPFGLDFTNPSNPVPLPFPNCISVHGPYDVGYEQRGVQSFKDKSVFGELSWHLNARTQITFGGRHLKQEFTNGQTYNAFPFGVILPAVDNNASTSNNIWKVNPSFEYTDNHRIFATWSQGFRRGGANAFPNSGVFIESPEIRIYQPDKTDNFEVGLKGRFAAGWVYSLSVFDITWDKPQITTVTPVTLAYVVVNGNKARSTGVAFDSSGPLGIPGLTYTMGLTYANARLTKDFTWAANDGTGTLVPGLIFGKAGQQLPGSPKTSGAITLNYEHNLAPGYSLNLSLNETYTGRIRNGLANIRNPYDPLPAYTIGSFSASLQHKPWQLTGYVNNFTDKRALIAPPSISNAAIVGPLVNGNTINRPRTAGLQLSYSF